MRDARKERLSATVDAATTEARAGAVSWWVC